MTGEFGENEQGEEEYLLNGEVKGSNKQYSFIDIKVKDGFGKGKQI